MMILNYKSKKDLKENIGKPLDYTETSFFGAEYKTDGEFCGSNRPQLLDQYPKVDQRGKREFFASVTMADGLIKKVT
jgi:hypothetical protein